MSTKRKLPRRKLPWISNLLDHGLPYSKLPTKLVVLQRLFFEIESGYPLSPALSTVQQELKALWAYAGYEDILMSNSNLVVEIRKLHKSYKDLLKFNVAKRELPRFKKKEELFLDQLPVLFNITVKSLIPSNLITAEDRSFLLHNWDKTISSTLDVTTKQAVEKKLVRHEKSRKFTSSHSSNPSSSSVASPPPSSSPPPSPAQSTSSSPSPTPKRRRLTGTTLEVPPDILSRVAPVSDHLSLTHNNSSNSSFGLRRSSLKACLRPPRSTHELSAGRGLAAAARVQHNETNPGDFHACQRLYGESSCPGNKL